MSCWHCGSILISHTRRGSVAGSSPFTVMTNIFFTEFSEFSEIFRENSSICLPICTILKHTTFITLQEEKKRQRETENQISMTRDTCTYPRSNLNWSQNSEPRNAIYLRSIQWQPWRCTIKHTESWIPLNWKFKKFWLVLKFWLNFYNMKTKIAIGSVRILWTSDRV